MISSSSCAAARPPCATSRCRIWIIWPANASQFTMNGRNPLGWKTTCIALSAADNAMHVVFHPRGLRPFIVNWEAFAGQMIQILHRDVAQGGRAAAQLLDEIMAYPDLPAEWRMPRQVSAPSP